MNALVAAPLPSREGFRSIRRLLASTERVPLGGAEMQVPDRCWPLVDPRLDSSACGCIL
jgi:hypothetical protein